jgi:hypothetical protein
MNSGIVLSHEPIFTILEHARDHAQVFLSESSARDWLDASK